MQGMLDEPNNNSTGSQGWHHHLIIFSFRRKATRQKHFLHEVVTFSSNRFIFCNSKVCKHRVMPNIGSIAITLDVNSPFKSVQICMTSPNILCLKMLELGIDVKSITGMKTSTSSSSHASPLSLATI